LSLYFFSGNGTPDKNLKLKVINTGEKIVIHPYSIPQAIIKIPHHRTASPK
jgi:hypothetical protein